jgi:SAM-dependent methyltransferase
MPTTTEQAWQGAAWYSRRNLRLYDRVLAFNHRVFWRCPRSRLVALYDEHVSARHLDIGVADGWLLDRCRFPVPRPELTLLDLNPDALAVASERLARYAPRIQLGSALEPFALPPDSVDSIGMSLLLHCLPGTLRTKAVVFDHARAVLAPGGVVFGATVLNGGVRHTPLSRAAMQVLNRRGIFSNLVDTLEDLDAILRAPWDRYELRVHGALGIFVART